MAIDKKRRGKFHFATLISFVSLATFFVELRSRESNLRRCEPRALAVKTTDVSGVCSFRNQTAPRNFAIKLERGGVSVPDGVTPESLPIRYPPLLPPSPMNGATFRAATGELIHGDPSRRSAWRRSFGADVKPFDTVRATGFSKRPENESGARSSAQVRVDGSFYWRSSRA